MRIILAAATLCVGLMTVASAAPLRFDFEGTNATSMNTVVGFFEIESEATGTPNGGLESHAFVSADVLTAFQATAFDASGTILDTVSVDTSGTNGVVSVSQVRVNFNSGVPSSGSNSFFINASGFPPPVVSLVTNQPVAGGARFRLTDNNINSGTAGNLLFDDASSLLNTAASSGFDLNAFELADVSITTFGNFALTSLTVTDLTPPSQPPAVPLPAGAWLLLTALGGLMVARRKG